jgi:hypothetical protein
MAIEQRYYTTKTHTLLSSQIIVGFENVRCSYNVKERKTPQQMVMAGAITSGIARWRRGQVHEYRNGLMGPEIIHYLVKITAELADFGHRITRGNKGDDWSPFLRVGFFECVELG